MSNLGAVRHVGFDRKWTVTTLRPPGTRMAPANRSSSLYRPTLGSVIDDSSDFIARVSGKCADSVVE